MVYWQCYLKRECGWQMAACHGGGWPLHKARGRADTSTSDQAEHHAVPCINSRGQVCVISLNSHQLIQKQLQYNYI